MKKKILISAVLALVLVCLFAIAVGATTYNYSDEDGNLLYSATAELKATKFEMIQTESGSLAKTDADGNSLTWYVVADDNGASVRNITVKSIKTADAGVITNGKFTFTGDVTANNVVSVNFFGMDIKTFDSKLFMTTANKTPSGSNSEYCQVANGKYLLFLYLPKTLTEIPEHFCYRTSIRVLEFEDNTVLYKTVPKSAFQYMANLKELTIPEGIETLQDYSFRECLSLTYLKFPSTMLRLEHNVFHHSIGFETVIFGEKMEFIGYLNSDYRTVYTSWGIKNYQIKYMYVPNTVNTTGSSFDTFRGKDSNYIEVNRSLVFFFVGTFEEAQAVANCSADRHFKSAVNGYTSGKNSTTPGEAPVTYSVYLANKTYYDNLPTDRHVLVYDVPPCVAYGHKYVSSVTSPDCVNGGYTTHTCTACGDSYTDNVTEALGHTLSDATCTAPKTCSACGATDGEALGHSMNGWTLVDGTNVIVNECVRCDYEETNEIEASVNGVFYETFAQAYASLANGDVIKLYVDLSLSEILVIDKSITLDGNGHTITSTAARAINVDVNGEVAISNLTIVAGERAINIINKVATVEIDNVTATANNNAVMVATSAGAAKVTINNSILTGLAVVNVAGAGSNVEINNTSITNVDASKNENYGAITVSSTGENVKVTVDENSTITVSDDSREAYIFPASATVTGVANVGRIIALLGDAGFETIEEAIEYAKAGDTIVLLANVEAIEIITIGKAITLDGNGKTITSTAARAINVDGANGVTIKNVTVVASGERAINVINGSTNVSIDNVTATAANYAVNVAGSASGAVITINGCTLTGLNVVNVAAANVKETVNGGKLTCNDATDVENYAALALATNATNSVITATGVEFDIKDDSCEASNGTNTGKIVINGSEEGANIAYIEYSNGTAYTFSSIEAAIAKAQAGETIVLLAPVTITKDTVLDFSGITIKSEGDAFIVTNGATLTLNGNGTVNAGTAGVGSWCAVWANGGHAVINGGSYSVGGDSSASNANHQNDLIYTKNGGTAVINGGTFDGRNGIWALNENDANRGTIKVYGGNFGSWNPANNVSEGEGTNFLADGLHATANGDVYTVAAHSFDTVLSIAYANGYGKAGVKVLECACGETKEESVDALFVTLGYSASEAELGGITVGYKMNNEAIAKYEEITGNELVYGVFAAASATIGNDDIFDANGNTVSGVISKEASSMKLEALNLKLVGFNTEELMAAEIVMGMYVNDGAKVSYVQPEAPISGNKYHTVSYSKLPKEEE